MPPRNGSPGRSKRLRCGFDSYLRCQQWCYKACSEPLGCDPSEQSATLWYHPKHGIVVERRYGRLQPYVDASSNLANTSKKRIQYREPYAIKRREWLNGLKSGPCTDCGGTFPSCAMTWDHLPGSIKLFEIGPNWSYSKQRILAEIDKCELVCANCHAIRTYNRKRE